MMRGKVYPQHSHSMTASTPKAYCLLKVRPGSMEQVGQVLFCFPEVVSVEMVDGPQDMVVVTIRASDRKQMVQRAVRALMAVEEYTEQAWCYPVRLDGAAQPQPSPQAGPYLRRRLEAQPVNAERGGRR